MTMVGICQRCILLPVLFHIYLDKIMQDILQDHHTSISVGCRHICNLRFANDIDLFGGTNQELQYFTDKLVASIGAYCIEMSTGKSKVMVNSINNCRKWINWRIWGQLFLRITVAQQRSTPELIVSAAMARPDRIWKSSKIILPTKFRMYKSLMLSFLKYGCETWTLLADSWEEDSDFQEQMPQKTPTDLVDMTANPTNTSWTESMPWLDLKNTSTTVKQYKLAWFRHITHHDRVSKTILQGTLEGPLPQTIKEELGGRCKGMDELGHGRPGMEDPCCNTSLLSSVWSNKVKRHNDLQVIQWKKLQRTKIWLC